jgi:hypothetical protein
VTQPVDYSARRRRIVEVVEAHKAMHSPGDYVLLMKALAAAGFDDVLVTVGRSVDGKVDLSIHDYGSRE